MNKEQYINSINLNNDTDFPYLVLDVMNDTSIPRNPGFQVMHWHSDLQFIYVIDGKIEVQTLNEKVIIDQGNGVFINKNLIHDVKRKGICHYKSFIFPDYFLKFYFNSPTEIFVDSIVENNEIKLCVLNKNVNWCRKILKNLKRLSMLEKDKNEFYYYQVLTLLSTIWLDLRPNIEIPTQKYKNITNERMKKFLDYIEKNYSNYISLETLAKSADVSVSECLRCFKTNLETTPYKYLIKYRLSKAANLLKSTNDTIEKISKSVGFNQLSHFGKCFKERTGFSPKDYRKQIK